MATVGGQTAANVAAGASAANAATSAGAPNTIVMRDGNGNFNAGTVIANNFVGSFNGNGSSLTSVNAATLGGLANSSFWQTGGNAGTTPGVNFLGTTDNQPLELWVNHQRALLLQAATDIGGDQSVNVIGGCLYNFVAAGVVGATIAGGGNTNFGVSFPNQVTANFGTVGGGNRNTASGTTSMIAGGSENTAGNQCSTVGGGTKNSATGDTATIGGGYSNEASGLWATVPGGDANTASGQASTAMGNSTTASGVNRFAAGNQAQAINDGAFVWADNSSSSPFASTASNQFFVRATGGVAFMTTSVGIGALTPVAPLDVEINSASGINPKGKNWSYFVLSGVADNGGGGFNGSPTLAIYTPGNIGASTYYAFSDARIKNIAGPSDSAADLKTLRGIQITDYTYKDTIAKGNRPQKKVIAQQVEQVYPQAVRQRTDVVPDIYQKATVQDGWVQLATDLKVGERVKLIGEQEQGIHEVLEVREGAFRTDFRSATDQVFVFGREVKDFRTVDYEAIAMLNVSASQELARKVDAQQAEKEMLLKQLAALEAREQAREDRLARLESKLEKDSGARQNSSQGRASRRDARTPRRGVPISRTKNLVLRPRIPRVVIMLS